MSRKENIEKNMEFLIKELQKEWDVSKETKHRVTISVKDARSIRIRVQQQIADMGEMLHNQSDMKFDDILSLPVESIAADDSILFLWVTFPLLKECGNGSNQRYYFPSEKGEKD